ncbi:MULTISPECIES: hypothetical protein [unclassified Mycolicibacterium]|uniref:hypothetical protein n=1 Tax=unclassified Mycolicibacterium TaxID=2636767 RepID=UPI0012DF79CD|nr:MULTISPECIES: hypothetical protein [unclassified Mycolicibacterium]MUL81857.1 hypothetical protein [Mycolicibacterium sp. CBMA 329]MUL87623.1 hypothetical protein [Mycolicibacterium sp. CBMA 331]MUL99513.1 hypothetical protein [Mycolicibacterium sp. CBMA 334]MUM26401.1 hypothetical protein [Mycolicibacterium sp. CBMA 295]MUM37920.1 hypothetical protein [Mycolicibacterium sp. CBMA 247]
MAEGNNCTLVKLAGLGLAGVGVSHFVKPQLFESITKPAFPKDTQKHIYTNGGIETAIGLGLALPKTRKLAAIGTLGYLAYLAGNAVRNR